MPTDGTTSATITDAGANVTVRLLNFAGGEIAQATTDSSGTATVTFTEAVRSETYIVEVSGQDAGPYTLTTNFDPQNVTDSLTSPVNVTLPLLLDSLTLDQTTNPSDFYRIVAPENATLVVNSSLVTGDLDLRIYDSLGNLIKESATVGPTAEGLSLPVTAGEAYIIEVVARDTMVTANIQLTPTSDGTIRADLTANIGVQGFNQNGVVVAEATSGNMDDKTIVFHVVGGQHYFVGAVPTSEDAAGTYTLNADFVADAGNALGTPTNVDPNFSRSEAIGFNGDTDDNYRIISSEAGTLTVDVTNVSAPVDLHLYTADGNRVAISQNAGNADEQVTFDLEANVAYVIAVTPTSGSAQGFYDINSSFSVTSTSSSTQAATAVPVVDENQVGS